MPRCTHLPPEQAQAPRSHGPNGCRPRCPVLPSTTRSPASGRRGSPRRGDRGPFPVAAVLRAKTRLTSVGTGVRSAHEQRRKPTPFTLAPLLHRDDFPCQCGRGVEAMGRAALLACSCVAADKRRGGSQDLSTRDPGVAHSEALPQYTPGRQTFPQPQASVEVCLHVANRT